MQLQGKSSLVYGDFLIIFLQSSLLNTLYEEGIFMRVVHVWILKHDGSTQWYTIPWGKAHLDEVRKNGQIIFSSF